MALVQEFFRFVFVSTDWGCRHFVRDGPSLFFPALPETLWNYFFFPCVPRLGRPQQCREVSLPFFARPARLWFRFGHHLLHNVRSLAPTGLIQTKRPPSR